MRPALLVQGLIALILGAALGVGFLFGTGQLRTPSQVSALRGELAATRRIIASATALAAKAEADAEAEAEAEAEAARLAAEQRALEEQRAQNEAEARAKDAADQERQAADRAPRPKVRPVSQPAAYGVLTIRAQSPLTAISGGQSMFGKGLDLPFTKEPGKITLKDGRFTVNLATKVVASRLMIDVTVSPMAIVSAEGERLGTSAHGLQVGKSAFALGFNSPTAGDLNLVLQYKN